MILYTYDRDTKEYQGEIEANLDPLESVIQNREIFVIPPYCTLVKPNKVKKGFVNVYNEENKSWVLIEDHRGATVYNKKTGKSAIIEDLGSISKEFSFEEPFNLQEYKEQSLEILNVAYGNAQSLKVKVGKIEASIDDRFILTKYLEQISDLHPLCYFDMKDKSVSMNKEDIEKVIDALYVRSIELPEKRNEILNKIRSARSKKALDIINEEIKEFK